MNYSLLHQERYIAWATRALVLALLLALVSPAYAGKYGRHFSDKHSERQQEHSQDRRNQSASQQIWYRMALQFELPASVSHPEVKRWLKWYQKRPVHMARLQRQSQNWIGHVLTEVERRNLPAELVLLPAVESAYDPLAYSPGRAAGMWQFIPATATHLGLERDWWWDARRDVPRSTQAALNYLEYLHHRFDNWLHALAAYNAGEGNVSAAIRRNRKRGLSTDFWALKLPKETTAYVPKILALAEMIRDPALYNVELISMPNGPRFEVVETGGQIDIAQAASLADISPDLLRKFNPGLNRWATPPQGPHELLLPTYATDRFRRGIASLSPAERVTWQRHTVKNGETLSEIAEQYGSRTKLLKEVNQLSGNAIRIGQKLLIATGKADLSDYPTTMPVGDGMSAKKRRHYSVKDGESLWLIARRHNIRISDIERWNNVNRRRAVQPGQKLVLWLPENHKPLPSGPIHKIKNGDNLWDLARKYKISIDKLRRWNSLKPNQWLRPGQVLRLSAPAIAGNSPTRKLSYAVRNGDSLDRIARKFGVSVAQLCDWNSISPKRYLKPGQQLRVIVPITEQWRDA